MTGVVLFSYFTNSNIFTPKYATDLITGYSVYGGISAFTFAYMYMYFGLPASELAASVTLYLLIIRQTCQQCKTSFSAITIYWALLPVMYLLYSCGDFSSVLFTVVLALAVGRIGCICGGCCTSPPVPDKTPMAFKYTHPDHSINKRNKTLVSATYPTVHIEALTQLATSWLALRYPSQSPLILSMGSILSISLSAGWREQPREKWFFALLLIGFGLLTQRTCPTVFDKKGNPSFVLSGFVAVVVMFVLSQDKYLV